MKIINGNGYATKALNLANKLAKEIKKSDNIYVRIRDDNIASQKVANKCGFIKTDLINYIKVPKGKMKLRKYILSIS